MEHPRVSPAEWWLKLLLRANGVLGLLAIGAVAMPHAWLAWSASKVEPDMRVFLLVPYLARLLSAFYVLLGGLLLVFAGDVRRYRLPIQIVALWVWFGVVALFLPATQCASVLLQHWFAWCVFFDGLYGLGVSSAILILQRRIAREAPET